MQTRAIISAACKMSKLKKPIKVNPEIMIPLVGTKAELDFLEAIVRKEADTLILKSNAKIKYLVGTMIEIPRAALTADEIAESAEFLVLERMI